MDVAAAPCGKLALKRSSAKARRAREIAACRPWLDAEIAALRPDVVVALGATAAQSLMGRAFRITQDRGKVFTPTEGKWVFVATLHPSAILRGKPEERAAGLAGLVADLKVAAHALR